MRSVLIVLILLASFSLGAFTENAMSIMQVNPSSISKALGGGFIGVADVWHSNPLMAWDNPAMPALHEGISFGFMRDKPYDEILNEVYPEWYNNTGMATIGYKGIGVLLPSVNPDGKFGFSIETGEPNVQYEGGGYSKGKFNATMYGISFNPLEFCRQTAPQLSRQYEWLDVSAGLVYTDIMDDEWYSPGCKLTHTHITASLLDVGLLAHAKQEVAHNLVLEGSLGYKHYNLTNEYIHYPDESNPDPMGQNDVIGLGMGVSLPNNVLKLTYPLKRWTDNLATLRVLADRNFSVNIYKRFSAGVELGLLDTFYFRGGTYTEFPGKNHTYLTWGYGVNLPYKDMISFEFNLSREDQRIYWGNGILDSWDAMVQFDGVRMWKRINKL